MNDNKKTNHNTIFKKEYLEYIREYPVEIIALLPAAASVAFFYKFFENTSNYITGLYSIGLFLISIGALSFLYRNKEKKLPISTSIIKRHPTLFEVSDAINAIFKNVSNNSEVTQTYIKNNFLAGSQDILFKDVLVDIKEGEKKPKVNRLFVLFDPLDINFAEHSLELSSGKSFYHTGNYSDTINNIYIGSDNGEKIVNIIPSITMVDGKVLVTFPSNVKNKTRFPRKLIENPQGTSTKGIEVEDPHFYEEYKNHLTNTEGERLNDIKLQFFERDRISYYYSIIFSLAKEILHDKNLSDQVIYLGIVGSLANYVENTVDNPEEISINDLDLQIICNETNSKIYRSIRNLCEHVCKRFSIKNNVDFFVETKSSPVKQVKQSGGVLQLPIHLLISDKNSCNTWDKYIAIDRVQHGGNVTFEWILNKDDKDYQKNDLKKLVSNSLGDNNIRFYDITSKEYLYSIPNCISVLEDNSKALKIKSWEKNDSNDYRLMDSDEVLSPIELANFAKYSLKWGVVNFYNAAENYNLNKNNYNRNFKYALSKVSEILPNIETQNLLDIYSMEDNKISKNEISTISKNLKSIVQYIKSYK